MNEANSATVQKLIAELDVAIPKEGARVQLCQYGGGPDESRVIATRRGYLRLGIEFLRAAYAAPCEKNPGQIAVNLDYLLTDSSDIGFDWFERVDSLPEAASDSRISFFSRCFGMTVMVVLGCIFLVGIGSILAWIFGW